MAFQFFFALILMSLYTGGVATFLMMEDLAFRGEWSHFVSRVGHDVEDLSVRCKCFSDLVFLSSSVV